MLFKHELRQLGDPTREWSECYHQRGAAAPIKKVDSIQDVDIWTKAPPTDAFITSESTTARQMKSHHLEIPTNEELRIAKSGREQIPERGISAVVLHPGVITFASASEIWMSEVLFTGKGDKRFEKIGFDVSVPAAVKKWGATRARGRNKQATGSLRSVGGNLKEGLEIQRWAVRGRTRVKRAKRPQNASVDNFSKTEAMEQALRLFLEVTKACLALRQLNEETEPGKTSQPFNKPIYKPVFMNLLSNWIRKRCPRRYV
ncbi:hypothetical protein R3P38DRAFT_3539487 [Favolaschia claudopus]|uniref:Uncharacterized protein n=1 Tax=Favolaschia claudopus TaxID=2862362 RepID=A0AAW0BAA5_9AGAR